MPQYLLLTQFAKVLAPEPLMNGVVNAATKRSFGAKMRAFNTQLTIMTDILIHHNPIGDHLLILNTSELLPTFPNDNMILGELLELLTSLEEDCFRLINGEQTPALIVSYNTLAHDIRLKVQELLASLGLAEVDSAPLPPSAPTEG